MSTTGSTSPATRSRTTIDSAPTCSSWSASWGCRRSAIQAATSSPASAGRTRSVQRGPANPPRPGLALDGVQRGGDRRVRRLAREDRQRTHVRPSTAAPAASRRRSTFAANNGSSRDNSDGVDRPVPGACGLPDGVATVNEQVGAVDPGPGRKCHKIVHIDPTITLLDLAQP